MTDELALYRVPAWRRRWRLEPAPAVQRFAVEQQLPALRLFRGGQRVHRVLRGHDDDSAGKRQADAQCARGYDASSRRQNSRHLLTSSTVSVPLYSYSMFTGIGHF